LQEVFILVLAEKPTKLLQHLICEMIWRIRSLWILTTRMGIIKKIPGDETTSWLVSILMPGKNFERIVVIIPQMIMKKENYQTS